jgi:hypothetical protein
MIPRKEKAPLDARPLRAYVRAMRMILTGLALVALCSPVAAQTCYFYNKTGQYIDFQPESGRMTFYPAYDDSRVECSLIGQAEGDAYAAACTDGPGEVVAGMSEPDKPFVDVIVFHNIFFWLECRKTT